MTHFRMDILNEKSCSKKIFTFLLFSQVVQLNFAEKQSKANPNHFVDVKE